MIVLQYYKFIALITLQSKLFILHRIARKFGGELNLAIWHAVYITTTKLKSAKISYSHIYIPMVILYQTTKFGSLHESEPLTYV